MHDMGGFLCGTEVSVSRGYDTACYISYLRMLENTPNSNFTQQGFGIVAEIWQGSGLGNGILDHNHGHPSIPCNVPFLTEASGPAAQEGRED